MKTLSLIVPVYDAPDLARALTERIRDLRDAAGRCGFELVETIFVDDGSSRPFEPDESAGVTVLRNGRNRGKGYSVRRGALAARGEWVMMSDVDLSAPLTEFGKLAAAAVGGAWMVCGSRYGRPGVPWRRRILSSLFRLAVDVVVGASGVRDTQCGFKLFRMDVMRAVFEAQRIERFAFDVELIRRVVLAGGRVDEVQVDWRGGRRSSLRVMRDAPRMLWDLLRVRLMLRG